MERRCVKLATQIMSTYLTDYGQISSLDLRKIQRYNDTFIQNVRISLILLHTFFNFRYDVQLEPDMGQSVRKLTRFSVHDFLPASK